MDATVLGLYIAGLALTVGGVLVAAVDVAQRVRRYRAALAVAPAVTVSDPRLRALSGRTSSNVANELRAETAARTLAERRLADAAGVTANLRRLWLSASVALFGVLMSGAADILATVRAS